MPGSYWNEEIETLSSDGIERLESERLPAQMAYLYASSDYFRARFDQVGIKPQTIKNRIGLAAIPFMEKHEIAESQQQGQLLGINQCAAQSDIIRIQATGGTTGRPMRVGWTRQDLADYCEVGSRALWANSCRPDDLVFECINYNLYAGGVSDHMCFENLGAATMPYGVGNSLRLLEMMLEIQQDISIWATPSYAIRLAQLARENNMEPRDMGLRKGFFPGEAGMQVAGYREKIEDSWGLVAFDMYGTGELGMHSGECSHRNHLHYGATGVVLTELIDPETTEPVTFEEGAIGEFVYTSQNRRRYVDKLALICACARVI